MMDCITKLIVSEQPSSEIELGIALVGEAEATMKLHRTISSLGQGFTGNCLGHSDSDLTLFIGGV